MWSRNSFTRAAILAAGVLLAVILPYVLAARLAPADTEFTGFLVNPWDGFSYLAKMRQGADGHWLFRLPYAPEPGEGAVLFVFYLGLGRLAATLRLDPILAFHAARVLCGGLMFAAAFLFLRRAVPDEAAVHWSLALFALGSGLGWLAGPLGLLTSDLLVPEAVPFFSALVNPHFPLATALLAALGVLLLDERAAFAQVLACALVGVIMAWVQPFAVLIPLAVGTGWLAWEAASEGLADAATRRVGLRSPGLKLGAFVAGAGPWLLYDLWAVRTQPALALWNAQNHTPSPPVWSFVLGFGLVGAAAVYGGLGDEVRRRKGGRLLITWVIVNAALLYAPFQLQRRLALGLFLPLAALAGMGLGRLVRERTWGQRAAALVLVLSVPSNLLVTAAGLGQVAAADALLLYDRGERQAYRWIDQNLASGALVLASPVTGNRLPAYADVRVLYGHPFETPRADQQREKVERLFTQGSFAELSESGVNYVVYGPRERDLGSPAWLAELRPVFRSGAVSVLEVPGP